MAVQVSWRAKLALIGFGLAIGLGGVELALGILERSRAGSEFESVDDLRRAMLDPRSKTEGADGVELAAIINPHPDDRIIYDLRPNLDVRFQRARVTTNSCGMRDVERAVAKPDGTYRIAVLGDSFTFGWGVEQDQPFARRLEDNLNRLSTAVGGSDPIRFEVLNFGVPGYSTFQEVALFEEKALDFEPDAVLVYFVQNDFGYPFFVRDVNQPGGLLSATRFARLSWQAIDPKVEEQRLALQRLDPNSSLARLSNLSRERGIRMLVAFNPREEWVADYNRLPALRRKKRPIEVLDLRPDLLRIIAERKIPEADLTLSFDPHPSPLRHQLLGDLLTPHFMGAIR